MQKSILLNLIAGVSVVVSGLTSIPVHAQNNQSDVTGTNVFTSPIPGNNQSDVTGSNVFNNTVPGLFEGNKLSDKTISQSEELAQKLADADRACQEKQECGAFNELLEESKTFLGNVNQNLDRVREIQVNRPW